MCVNEFVNTYRADAVGLLQLGSDVTDGFHYGVLQEHDEQNRQDGGDVNAAEQAHRRRMMNRTGSVAFERN